MYVKGVIFSCEGFKLKKKKKNFFFLKPIPLVLYFLKEILRINYKLLI